ncbi:MAG: GNAT family N-acetyltransferase [Eubacteriales bacterium]|nr:GNAT family N-acetyltransferase [Eubacteriales bacterium]
MNIQTHRLTLRPPRAADADDIYEMRSSEYVLRYNAMRPMNPQETAEMVLRDEGSPRTVYLEHKSERKVIGAIFLEDDDLRYGVTSLCFSYYLNQAYASHGYMTEALSAVIAHCFDALCAEVVSARVFQGNIASMRVLETLGFTREGCLRRCVKGYGGVVYDDTLFSLLREEFVRTPFDAAP